MDTRDELEEYRIQTEKVRSKLEELIELMNMLDDNISVKIEIGLLPVTKLIGARRRRYFEGRMSSMLNLMRDEKILN